jgi:hypothetical protein
LRETAIECLMLVGEHGGDSRTESGACTAPEARRSLQDCSIDLTMTKIASMTPPVPRGKIIGERVGAQPVDELDHIHQCEAGVDF